jgi:CheY-like chemotaxis protein
MNNILIIEDEKDVLENLCDMMELEDFNPLSADNGLDGISIAKKELPDLIICDIAMPYADGFEVLKALKYYPSTKDIPIIILTAKSNQEDVDKAMHLGAEDYITKPFVNQQLIETIKHRLELSKK